MEKTFKDVAKSTIAQDEEGNVLYFVKKAKDANDRDHVLSLAKLKTLEYRLFRKMREKWRNFFSVNRENKHKVFDVAAASKDDFNKIVKKFKAESSEFLEGG
jgi:uncharacterized protein (DUF2225 family)